MSLKLYVTFVNLSSKQIFAAILNTLILLNKNSCMLNSPWIRLRLSFKFRVFSGRIYFFRNFLF